MVKLSEEKNLAELNKDARKSLDIEIGMDWFESNNYDEALIAFRNAEYKEGIIFVADNKFHNGDVKEAIELYNEGGKPDLATYAARYLPKKS